MRSIPVNVYDKLKAKSLEGDYGATGIIRFTDKPTGDNTILYCQCEISREDAAFAQRCTFEFYNVNPNDEQDIGYYSPDRGDDNLSKRNDWYQQLLPGKNITVEMGYGNNIVQVFKGCIDQIDYDSTTYKFKVDCRDDAWMLLDANVVGDDGSYYLRYENMDTSDIATDLFIRAGIKAENIYTAKSKVVLSVKEFQNCTYADAVSKLMDLSGYEFRCDEYGKISFLPPTSLEPKIEGETKTFNGDILRLNNHPIVSSSEAITDSTGSKYSKDTDYSIDYKTGIIKRIASGSIPSGATIYADYIYAAYVFEEGKDLESLHYTISRFKQYAKIIVNGDGVQGIYELPSPESRGVPQSKVIGVNDESLNTATKCNTAANRLGTDMARRYRKIEFAAVGVPWLQIGDCVQIIESASTVSEIYRISSMGINQNPEGIIMSCTAYYYGYTPL